MYLFFSFTRLSSFEWQFTAVCRIRCILINYKPIFCFFKPPVLASPFLFLFSASSNLLCWHLPLFIVCCYVSYNTLQRGFIQISISEMRWRTHTNVQQIRDTKSHWKEEKFSYGRCVTVVTQGVVCDTINNKLYNVN